MDNFTHYWLTQKNLASQGQSLVSQPTSQAMPQSTLQQTRQQNSKCVQSWEEYKKLDSAYHDLHREYFALRGEQTKFSNVPKDWLVKMRELRGRCLVVTAEKERLSQKLDFFNIEDQYYTQYEILKKLNLLQLLPESKKWGIVGIDGKEYPVPTWEQIENVLVSNREKYKEKMKQGFTRFQLTPFALPLREMILVLEKSLLQHYKEGKLFAPNSNKQVELNTSNPVIDWFLWRRADNPHKSADELGEIIYDPQTFSESKYDHIGKIKQEILDEDREKKNKFFAGWKVLLLEDDLILKGEGQGKTIGGRKQLESNETPIDYLKKLQSEKPYSNEQGLTNEDWLMLFMNNLEEHNQVIDDYSEQGKGACLLASWHPDSRHVSVGLMNSINTNDFVKKEVSLGGVYPTYPVKNMFSCRTAVRLSFD